MAPHQTIPTTHPMGTRRRRPYYGSLLATVAAASEGLRVAAELSNSNAFASPLLQTASACASGQAELRLTLHTDAHSVEDNSWRISQSGEVIGSASVQTDEAVVSSSACLDVNAGEDIECWDWEMHDDFGDGLTYPHSRSGGTPGGFDLHFNNQLVASHSTVACLVENEDGKYNKCAGENGFEYCGLKICRVLFGKEETFSVSSLSGSQCDIDIRSRSCRSTDSLPSVSNNDVFQVNIETDGYSADISWDLRDTEGNLVMSGGNPDIIGTLSQPGSVSFDNFESYSSSACLPQDKCYDFRAYDVYGDGISCGAKGSISLSFPPGSKTIKQKDENVATLQRLDDGTKMMACMNKKEKRGVQKWSFCHVRLCQGGSVIGLEGNQCSFGDEELIDSNATGGITGLGMSLNSQSAGPQVIVDTPCSEGGDCTMAEEFSITKPELMTASLDDKDEGLSWAEYYDSQIEGKDGTNGSISPNSQESPLQYHEHRLPLETFYANLLSPDSPFKLKYYRPHKMSIAISTYLLTYLLTNIEGWENGNAPLHFDLDCNRLSDFKRVVGCSGDAIFPKSSLPKKSVFNDLIHQAFSGEYEKEFLSFMYIDYDPDIYEVEESNILTKKEKKDQKLQNKLQQNSAILEDKKKEKLRDKLKNDEMHKREFKKAIRNKTDGRHLRSVY